MACPFHSVQQTQGSRALEHVQVTTESWKRIPSATWVIGDLRPGGLRCRWVPVKERSRSLALVYSGMYSGSILGLALSPHMVEVLKWPSVFYIFGSLGVVWYLVWQAKAASSPAADPAISKDERAYIETDVSHRCAFLLHRCPCHNLCKAMWGQGFSCRWMRS